jgi:predicted nucleic acid-binding protein
VDTWAWVALADRSDQYHQIAEKQHRKFLKKRRRYATSDFVVGELIDYLYSAAPATEAQTVVGSLLARSEAGAIQLLHVSPQQFDRAWDLRQKYDDKPDISFVDFTSMVLMLDLGITEVFTGDAHFRQVGLGFRMFP